jgi:prephenate dehydrogenase
MSSDQTSIPPPEAELLLPSQDVVIYGIGLMGGSLALALRPHVKSITAIDPDEQTRALAQEFALFDQIYPYPPPVSISTSLIFLASPVRSNNHILQSLHAWHSNKAVVLDLGSTKSRTLKFMEELPARFDPVGGHPMCGKEKSGLEHASADLFNNAVFALCGLPRTSSHARALVTELVKTIQSQPLWIDPHTHDRWVAYTSHLPYLLATSLASVIPQETAPLAGPGYQSTTRLAESNLPMMLDIISTNRENILIALQETIQLLQVYHQQLESSSFDAFAESLSVGQVKRKKLLSSKHELPA